MDTETSRLSLIARRARAGLVVLALAAFGAAFTACGDDNDDVQDNVEDIQNQAKEAGEDAQKQLDEAQRKADEATQDAQGKLDDAKEKAGGSDGGSGGY